MLSQSFLQSMLIFDIQIILYSFLVNIVYIFYSSKRLSSWKIFLRFFLNHYPVLPTLHSCSLSFLTCLIYIARNHLSKSPISWIIFHIHFHKYFIIKTYFSRQERSHTIQCSLKRIREENKKCLHWLLCILSWPEIYPMF